MILPTNSHQRNVLVYLSPPGPKPVAADLVVLYDNDELRIFKVPFRPGDQ
jgi:hypothetical protein